MAVDGKTMGLALSGGGYRATLFGLGSLWRLNDAGLLGRLDRITGVSGGAIVLGVLAHAWRQLRFADGRASNFAEVVAAPVRRLCSSTIDIGAGVAGTLVPGKSAGEFLADRYRQDLFGDTGLKALPSLADGAPIFIFYATNLQTGRSFRFRQDYIADYMLGVAHNVDIALAVAVAASSAFPPIFSPIVLKTDPAAWTEGSALPELDALRRRIVLADGGVYDNMGLEALVGRHDGNGAALEAGDANKVDIVLASDAGAPFEVEDSPHEDKLRQLGRVRDILIDQTRALRKRWLVAEFTAKRQRGAYWGIGTRMAAFAPGAPRMAVDSAASDALKQVPTRLAAFDDERQGQLINWGYALCDISLRANAGLAPPLPSGWPVPEWPL